MNTEEMRFLKESGYFVAPQIVQIEITNTCPLRCPQCFINEFDQKYLEWDTYIKYIDELSDLKTKAVVLFGGEPMAHDNIVSMVDYAVKKALNVIVYTSGWKLDDEMIQKLMTYKDKVHLMLSLNGSCKEVHEKSRGSFELSYNAAKKLGMYGAEFCINWVSRHDNVEDLPNLIKLAKEVKAKYINIVCNKINVNYVVEEALDIDDYAFISRLIKQENGFLIVENCNMLLQNIANNGSKNLSGCAAGFSACSITVNGEFVPCLRLLYKEKYASFKEYWNNSEVLKELREARKDTTGRNECKDCIYLKDCHFCHALSKKTYEKFSDGLENCPIKEIR